MTVRLHIDTLVLEGLPLTPADRMVVHRATEAELARLLAEHPRTPATSLARPTCSGAPLLLPPGHAPAELGRRIARSIVAGLPL